jgi:hypothetical protein
MLDLSQHTISSDYINTPVIQAHLVDGPHLQNQTAWLLTQKLDILLNPEQTASFSLMPLQDCQQNNDYMT